MGRSISTTSSSSALGRFRVDRRLYLVSGSYTFIVPDAVTQILGVAIGGGGSGARGDSSVNYARGGAGGGYAQGIITVTPGQSIAVTVGSGGASVGINNTPGNAGSTSSLGTFLTATGGAGGLLADNGAIAGGTGTTSGVSEAFTSTGGSSGTNTSAVVNAVTGGGSSGTPFGTGQTSSNIATSGAQASAGGSWCCLPTRTLAANSGGEGGHGTNGYGSMPTGGTQVGANGGSGRTAAGGLGAYYVAGTTNAIGMPGNGSGVNWWFPWEIDGSGGGTWPYFSLDSAGGNSGPGASGPGIALNNAGCVAGNGGFGGGGGGASGGSSSKAVGGSGGNGGGGGAATSTGASTNIAISGRGGPGAVIIYW